MVWFHLFRVVGWVILVWLCNIYLLFKCGVKDSGIDSGAFLIDVIFKNVLLYYMKILELFDKYCTEVHTFHLYDKTSCYLPIIMCQISPK